MFSQAAFFSGLALLASVTYAIPSTYTSLHVRAMDKRMVTCQGIFWLKATDEFPIKEYVLPVLLFIPLLILQQR